MGTPVCPKDSDIPTSRLSSGGSWVKGIDQCVPGVGTVELVSESIIKHLRATEPCTQPPDLCVEVGPPCKLGLSSDPLPGNETSLGNGFCVAGSKSDEVRLEGRWPTDCCDGRPCKN